MMKIINQQHLTPSFHNLFEDFFTEETSRNTSFKPLANIKKGETNFTIDLAAPGFKKDNFEISLNEDRLTISSRVEENKEETKESITRREFSSSSFSRSFSLPKNIDKNEISASYTDGILSVVIPKKEKVNELKSIQVK